MKATRVEDLILTTLVTVFTLVGFTGVWFAGGLVGLLFGLLLWLAGFGFVTFGCLWLTDTHADGGNLPS